MAVQCLKKGAYDFLVKPISREELFFAVKRSLERKKLDTMAPVNESKISALKCPEAFKKIITCSPNMFKVLSEAELHAKSDIPVLITGESGTGKDLLARAIHQASQRIKFPFIPVNMTSLSEGLFDAEFCGHTKGAFTGAIQDSKGYLEQTNHGTIFMDEIGSAPLAFQAKLLRILQDGEYMKLGTSQPRKVDIRFITATNEDLETMITKGLFRKDFYYRLNGASLHLPPLRKRKDDIPLLISKFLADLSDDKGSKKIDEKALSVLMEYDYPGNIRELKSIIHSAINLAQDKPITVDCLPVHLRTFLSSKKVQKKKTKVVVVPLSKIEKDHIINTYNATGRNKTQTAHILNVGLNTLRRKLLSYGL
jgi:DNA-binding NtrC family response regulator